MSSQKIFFDYPSENTLSIKLAGDWRLGHDLPQADDAIKQLSGRDIKQINFNASEMTEWGSGLITFLALIFKECGKRGIQVSREGLPQGVVKLLSAFLEEKEASAPAEIARESLFDKVGGRVVQVGASAYSLLDFLGDIAVSLFRLLRGKAYFRWDEFIYTVQRCGASALPLVSLISMLVGMILAFVGDIQLKMFGAQIFIADIVGIAMVRVMGAIMTGIIMSGRTGAAFAAELGLMQTNEEIDALKTLGISPVEFLIMPRVLALVIMMPLLTLYADFMGIFGGFAISTTLLGLNPVEYLHHTETAVRLSNLWVGLIHGFIFGIIIAVAGCLRGIRCERSAAAVGEATTSAVVTAITAIVIATAIITYVCQVLGV